MAVYDQPDSHGAHRHHPGLQAVQRKAVVPRRVVPDHMMQAPDARYAAPQAQYTQPEYAQPRQAQPQYAPHQAAHDPYGQPYQQGDAQGYVPTSVAPSPVYYLGAALSLGLIIGVGVWGYQIAMRDVNGIPVVAALDIPARVQPEDPGGRQAAHQGLAVNDVQANGEATATADRLILAPPPIDLIEGDGPVSDIIPAVARSIVPTNSANDLDSSIQLAVASAITQSDGTTYGETRDAQGNVITRIAPSVPGVSVSKVPLPRPQLDLGSYTRLADPTNATSTASNAGTAPTQVAAVSGVDVDPSAITVGTKLVQIGAFDSEDAARAEWDRLTSQFGGVFEGKQRLIQSAAHSGRSFYRLRVHGFDDTAQTGQFCSEMIARSVICIPVEIR
ncbi:SPOR domain-containing protein [Halocynthiibacter namhaensis]|uniref:SPOR domain-containing protein n=1 Tax=Halocynthiibacter namhaensis TaxID=1290553 RepID=UPI00068EEA0F|nr:SPOR domain-containing protein [Halocynthiibacter namhaensis]